ncbi:MAG: alpha/beta fold hydrolase [Verrucomicrobiota bacterium]
MIPRREHSLRFLALHGFTGEGADFAELSALVGGRWSFPDLPGHGINKDATEEEFSLDALAEHLCEGDNGETIGIGYSMGGRLLLNVAARRPGFFRGLILIGASPGLAQEPERAQRRKTDAEWIQKLSGDDIEEFFRQWWRQPVLSDIETLVPKERRLKNNPAGLARSLRFHGNGTLPSLWTELPKITLPTLICVGEKDEKFLEIGDRMTELLPKGDVVAIPGCHHAPHWEDPKLTAKAFQEFAEKLP